MAEQTESVSRFEPLSALWRILAAAPTLLIVLGLLALALAAGTVIPQMPRDFVGNPQAWLAVQAGVWGQASSSLYNLGLFDLYSSLGFRSLLILAGLCLFVRTADSIELAWRAMRRERWTQAALLVLGTHPPEIRVSVPLALDETAERLGTLLSESGYWWSTVPDRATSSFVAVRRRLVLWARPLAYASLLFALVCMLVTSAWGWQGEPWHPREGDVQAVGHDTPYAVRLELFRFVPGDGQQPSAYFSGVTWLEGETGLGQTLVRAGRASRYAGIALRQVGYVPIVRMRGRDGDDRPLMLETQGDVLSMTGEAEIRFSSPDDEPLVLIPARDLLLVLSFEPDCDDHGPLLTVSRLRGGGDDREVLGILGESGSVFMGDLRFEVDLAFAPILRLEHYPAAEMALIGVALFIVALIASWFVPPRLLWIAIAQEQEQHTLARLVALPSAGAERSLSQLAKLIREELKDGA